MTTTTYRVLYGTDNYEPRMLGDFPAKTIQGAAKLAMVAFTGQPKPRDNEIFVFPLDDDTPAACRFFRLLGSGVYVGIAELDTEI